MPEDPVVHLRLPVDAFTGKLLSEYGDEVRDPGGFPKIDYKTAVVFAVEFLDRELAPDLSWNLAPHPLDAENTYALSGGCDRSADASPMFLCDAEKSNLPGDWPDGSDPDPARGRLTFRLTTDARHFLEIAGNGKLRKFCSMTVTVNSGAESAVAARIPFLPSKRADESAGGSSGGSGPATTVNGVGGPVVLADADGNPLPVDGRKIIVKVTGSGLHEDPDPIDAYQAYDDTIGPYTWLDATNDTLTFFKLQRNLKKVTFPAVAEDGESSGNVRLIAAVNGVDTTTFTVPVTASATPVTLDIDLAAGMLTIRRDNDNILDTLDCAVRIYAVSAWRAES